MRVARSGGVFGLLRLVWRNFRAMGWDYLLGAVLRAFFQLRNQAAEGSGPSTTDYAAWRSSGDTWRAPRWAAADGPGPKISVVMPVYRPDLGHFRSAVESIQAQDYPHWELCMADDASGDPQLEALLDELARSDDRIKLCFRQANGHISACSNSALELASGDYVLLFDQDDLLPAHALGAVAKAIGSSPEVAIIYSDEDKVDETGSLHFDPYFKPDFDQTLFLGQNLVSHLGVYRRDLVSAAGGFCVGLEGSQDHDLALRVLEICGPQRVMHIPEVLYHWRASRGSTALANSEKSYASVASRRAVQEHLGRMGVSAHVEPVQGIPFFNRVVYDKPVQQCRVRMVFLLPDATDSGAIARTVRQVLDNAGDADWQAEILVSRSGRADVRGLTRRFASAPWSARVRCLEVQGEQDRKDHLAKLPKAGTDLVCVVSVPLASCPSGWLSELASVAVQPGVSAVAPRFLGPIGTQCHGGIVFPDADHACHAFEGMPAGANPMSRSSALSQRFMALSPALIVSRPRTWERFDASLPLDTKWSIWAMMLEHHRAGSTHCWTPFVSLRVGRKAARRTGNLMDELDEVQRSQWRALCASLLPDPAYNPNLSVTGDFLLRVGAGAGAAQSAGQG